MSEDVYLVYRSSLGDATHDYGIRRTRSDSSASTSLPISIVDLSNGDIWAYAVSPDTLPVIPEPAYAGWIVGLAALGLLAMRRVRR